MSTESPDSIPTLEVKPTASKSNLPAVPSSTQHTAIQPTQTRIVYESGKGERFENGTNHGGHGHQTGIAAVIAALGVVFGDIGTSPLYALKECFAHGLAPTPENIYGILSIIFWSLILVVTIKYLLFILKADNQGEGGIFALLALIRQGQDNPNHAEQHGKPAKIKKVSPRLISSSVLLAVFGSSLLYGDGVITPAISVLSAVEGINVVTNAAEHYVVPITMLILTVLFLVQKSGTSSIGKVFGPIMFIWFASLGILGAKWIIQDPHVLYALSPHHALNFVIINKGLAFTIFGAAVLAVTGCEALYADMGHFGRQPIQRAWFFLVFPCLALNYFGQGAMLLGTLEHHPEHIKEVVENTFYNLVSKDMLIPMVILATLATVIASQALISGAYSMTRQAIELGFLPRLEIKHTDAHNEGQIYLPTINYLLLALCLFTVTLFPASGKLAAAYGIAVTANMAITTLLFYYVATRTWGMNPVKLKILTAVFLTLDLLYFTSNMQKVTEGGWFPLVIAAFVTLLMTNWVRGRKILAEKRATSQSNLEEFLSTIDERVQHRVPGTAIFMVADTNKIPLSFNQLIDHMHVLHEQVVFCTIQVEDVPRVPFKDQLEIVKVKVGSKYSGFIRMTARFGFMQTAYMPDILRAADIRGLKVDPDQVTFFLGRELLRENPRSQEYPIWRQRLFALLFNSAFQAHRYYHIPPQRVIELGVQMEM